jgi:hypothetical protein
VVYLTLAGKPKSGWVAQQYVRVTTATSGRGRTKVASGDHCDFEGESGAEACVTLSDATLDCSKDYSGKYYDSCEVAVEYEINTDYDGDDYLDVEVECDVEINYSGRNLYMPGSESDSQSENHSLYAYGSESNTLTFDFSFGLLKQATKVAIESAGCEVSSVNLW